MNKILKIENLRKYYHSKKNEVLAIDNFSFEMEDGEFIAIVGPSGCGKSTLLSILCGLEEKSDGTIDLNDNVKIGYMLQQDSLFEFKNILDNCLLGLDIKKQITEDNKKYVLSLLESYGLKDFIYSYPANLSGGMRQRVALIRTLATNPNLIILDEPFSALDYQTTLVVADDIHSIIKKEKKSAIMVTHDISLAISMADKVIVLSNRPAKIKKIFDINLSNKSTPLNNRKDKEFSKYYDLIWKEIDFHV